MTRPQDAFFADEDELLSWLRKRAGAESARLLGNDAAVLPPESWAVTMDTQIAGVHFPKELDPAWVARRLLAVNLSDLAAMGAQPAFAFLSLSAPPRFDHRRFFEAFLGSCQEYSCTLAGGDLTHHSVLTTVLTLIGRKSQSGRWIERRTAKPGDAIWLGGRVGESAAGCFLLQQGGSIHEEEIHLPSEPHLSPELRIAARQAIRCHLDPQPQLALGEYLATGPSGAAIDLSDGLSRDLHRLCRESGVGALLHLDRLPLAQGFERLAEEIGIDPLEAALFGGEDYVLLFTLPSDAQPPSHFGCSRIGSIEAGDQVMAVRGDQKWKLEKRGWDHVRKPSR